MTRLGDITRSRSGGWLVLALALVVVLHTALYHTANSGQGSVLPPAVLMSSTAPWLGHQHQSSAGSLLDGLSEAALKRCPVPEVVVWPLLLLGSMGAAAGGAAFAAEPACRYPYWTVLPERPSRVVFQHFRL